MKQIFLIAFMWFTMTANSQVIIQLMETDVIKVTNVTDILCWEPDGGVGETYNILYPNLYEISGRAFWLFVGEYRDCPSENVYGFQLGFVGHLKQDVKINGFTFPRGTKVFGDGTTLYLKPFPFL